jgi:O-antigen polymerase
MVFYCEKDSMKENNFNRWNSYITILVTICLSVLFFNALVVDLDLYPFNQMGQILFFAEYFALLSPIFIVFCLINIKQEIDWIQILVLLFASWIVLRGKEGGIWYDEKFFYFAGCIAFFFIVRLSFKKMLSDNSGGNQCSVLFILSSIAIVAGTEAVIGQLQAFGLYRGYNTDYKVMGTFFNPAQFAGFLVASLPWSLYLAVRIKNGVFFTIISWLGFVSAGLIIIIMPATYSRAGYLGVATALGIWIVHRYNLVVFFKQTLNTRFKKMGAICITIAVISIAFVGLYHFKSESAFGRTLIWKVALLAIKDKPLTGHGFDTFQAVFAPSQVAYFSAEPRSTREQMVAGSVRWAFNEYLQTTVELGIVGIVLLITLFFYALLGKTKRSARKGDSLLLLAARSSLGGMMVFACFSNPFHSLPCTLGFFFSLSVISCFLLSVRDMLFCSFINVLPLVIILSVSVYYYEIEPKNKIAYAEWRESDRLHKKGAYRLADANFNNARPVLEYNGLFLQHMGKNLALRKKYTDAITILQQAKKYYCNDDWYLIMGECYEGLGNYNAAIWHYDQASFIIPHKFYPRYLLARLYDKIGEKQKCVMIAQELLIKKTKIESIAITEIKEEMRKIIERNTDGCNN